MLSFMIQHEDTTEIYINELLKVPSQNPEQESYRLPTPEEPGDPTTYTPIQQRIYNELLELREREELNPQDNEESRKSFLSNFDWTDTTLTTDERKQIEEILIDFHDIFARDRFDIDTNREFKVKLTPNDDRPAYNQSLPTPLNLKDDITVELALLHKYGIMTTLPFSKYASPIFVQTTQTSQTNSRSQENQHPNHRRLHQQEPACKHTIGCSTTYGRQEIFLQIRLLVSLPLPLNGRLPIHPDACLQLRKPNFRLSTTRPRT